MSSTPTVYAPLAKSARQTPVAKSRSGSTTVTVQVDRSELLKLDRQLCFALYSASLAMTRLYQPLLAPLGLTYPQYLVLLALWEQEGVTVSALGDSVFLDSGTLTPLLKRMEQAGLLRRQRDTVDERRVHIHLTAEAHVLKKRAAAVPECVMQATACSIPQLMELTAELQTLRGQLRSAQQAEGA
jgi:DNA-binding MarR family transcriptional regulator